MGFVLNSLLQSSLLRKSLRVIPVEAGIQSSLLKKSIFAPFDKLRTGFDTSVRTDGLSVSSWFSVRGEVSNHERKYFCKSLDSRIIVQLLFAFYQFVWYVLQIRSHRRLRLQSGQHRDVEALKGSEGSCLGWLRK